MKRILTIQDFSCVGKCSLTVALPILSGFGIETCALPTALLSNHTAFKSWSFDNLSRDIPDITAAWEREKIDFDGVYTGYLGAKELIEQVKDIIRRFNRGTVLIDPAMGDNGKLYAGFDAEYARANASLCALADVVTPNVTEASMILGREYKSEYDYEYLLSLCRGMADLGAKNVVITGVRKGDNIGVFCLIDGEVFEYYTAKEKTDLHGTGDIYSSALFGGIMRGFCLKESAVFACEYTKKAIRCTFLTDNPRTYGAGFEDCYEDIVNFVNTPKGKK